MALNFPDSPTLNQIHTDNTSGFSYQWNGNVWISFTPASTGNIKVLDDISGSFNGSTQTFALTSSSVAVSPPNPQSMIVNLGGVVQDPSDDYTVSGSNIIFSTPPEAGLSFSGVVLGIAVPVGVSTGDAYYRQIYSPTGVQTSFTFINGYGVGYLDVYRNGSKLVPTLDYTATDGLSFSLVTPAQAGDDVEAIGYRVTSVSIVNGSVSALSVSGIATIAGATNLGSNLNVTGIVTASSFVGNGSGLTGVGIGTTGSVNTTGIITASSFVGNLTGNVTGNVTGNLTGTASTASFATTSFGLSGSPAVLVSSAGVNTTSSPTKLYVSGSAASNVVGLGTTDATTTLDFSTANNFSLTLTGNITLANPTGVTTGQSGIIQIQQDSVGSRTIGFGSHWDFPSATAPTLSTGANALDALTYFVRSSTSIITNSLIGIGTL